VSILATERVGPITPAPRIVVRRFTAYRMRVTIQNIGSESVWIGSTGVSVSSGFRLGPRDSPLSFEADDEVWGVTNGRTYATPINAQPAFVAIVVESVEYLEGTSP
jgi:hypothetical protein